MNKSLTIEEKEKLIKQIMEFRFDPLFNTRKYLESCQLDPLQQEEIEQEIFEIILNQLGIKI